MTPISIAMLILGFAVGTLISTVIFNSQIKTITYRFENSLTVMEIHYKTLRELYDNFCTTSNELINSIVNNISKFYDIEIDTHKNIDEQFKKQTRIIRNELGESYDNLYGYIDTIHDDISAKIYADDNRWEIIQDSWAEVDRYMTNRVRKPDFEDFLHWLNWHHGVQIMAWNVPELGSVKVTMHYNRVADRPLFVSRMFDTEELSTHMESILESMFDELFKEAENYEHEKMATGAGASEGGDAGHQEAEQDAVLPGEADGKLVQSELAEDRVDDSPEAEEA